MNEGDRSLIQELALGQEDAWRILYERHYPFMCYLAAQYVHDDFLATALASDVISHLWEKRTTIHIGTSLRSYLLQSTRNRCLDYLKSSYQQREQTSLSGIGNAPPFDEDHPLGILLEKELEKQLFAVMDKMPAQTRRVFEKSRVEGLTYDQIAEQLGISPSTVKYHIRQALALLRKEFGEYLGLVLLFLSTL
ncbi:MAG: RNA polymerase sigma-70 factor [Bacteroidales bacterium]|nr:RNA polymerase sigma-70 factor [Bacteroidales bacterium]